MLWEQNDGQHAGPISDLVHEICRALNCTAEEIFWEVEYGIWNSKTSNWTGVMGRIHRREADLGCSDFLISSERNDVVAYSAPFVITKFQVHFRKYDVIYGTWNAHFKVLIVHN